MFCGIKTSTKNVDNGIIKIDIRNKIRLNCHVQNHSGHLKSLIFRILVLRLEYKVLECLGIWMGLCSYNFISFKLMDFLSSNNVKG